MFPIPSDHDVQLAARLVGMPEWDALWRIWDEIHDKHWQQVAYDFAMKDKQPDYAELQYFRGYFACGERLRREATRAVSKIEKNQPEEVPE